MASEASRLEADILKTRGYCKSFTAPAPGSIPGCLLKKEFFDLLNKILAPIRGYT